MLESRNIKVTACLLSFIILFLNFPLHGNSLDSKQTDECLKLVNSTHNQCKCKQSHQSVQIFCYFITVQIRLNSLTLECLKDNVEPYREILPKAKVGSFEWVMIKNCPFSRNETLKDVLDHMGVEEFKELIVEGESEYEDEMNANKYQLSEFQNVSTLTYAVKSSNPLPSDLFEGVPNVNDLTIFTNQRLLPKGLFDPMTNLTLLTVEGGDELVELSPGIFRNLKNLKYVYISGNKRMTILKDVFENATSIISLKLSGMNMVSFPSDIFEDLTNLTSLILTGILFSNLPSGIFRTTTKLETIFFIASGGQVQSLPADFFGNLKSLTDVQMSAGLEVLHENGFKGSSNIKVIDLSENKLYNLSVNLFEDQVNLVRLDLRMNLLTSLPNNIFRHTIRLKDLILSHNHLIAISNPIFSSLRSLENLWLDNNNLRFIDNNTFCYNKALRVLDLNRNRIDINFTFGLVDCLHSFANLQTIDLSHNSITIIHFKDLLLSLQNLDINLSDNQIETIDFSHTDSVGDLNLTVHLRNNPIKCDCKITDFVKYMQDKRIDYGLRCRNPMNWNGRSLMEIDPCDLTCPQTKPEVCLEPCQCEDSFCDEPFIVINCNNTKLVDFPMLPQTDLIRAERILLNLQNNNLSSLSVESSESYDKIFSLNLTGNTLENIEVSHLPASLEILDLRRNNLSTLPYHVFESWSRNPSKSKAVYLSQNPWICSCNLLKFVQNDNNKVVDRDVLQCVNASNQYQLLISYNSIQLCSKENQFMIVAGIGFCGLVFGLLVALYCVYKNEIKIWLYSHNLCLWFVSIEDLEKDKKYDGFISYSHKDKVFVQQKLLPFLEYGPHPFKICDHERDWLVGDTIPQQIIESVENSRRTLIVLSDNYLDSVWGRMEFQTAHQLSLKEKHPKLIIILYEKITNIEKLDSELKAYMNMNTYLEWGNPWFWKKLLYAMPHSKYSKSVRNFTNVNEDGIQSENEFEMLAM